MGKTIVLISILLLFFSCKESNKQPAQVSYKVDKEAVLQDYQHWYNYYRINVSLARDFIGLNADSIRIDKDAFLEDLFSGRFVPFKIRQIEDTPVYRLHLLVDKDENIKATIIQLAAIEMKNFEMEGKLLPTFDFTDIRGRHYNPENLTGKNLVLKSWFIHCVACVREFPDCNKLVDLYAGRSDIVFLSLALDKQPELIEFLQTKTFKYPVVPEAGDYLVKKLGLEMYPTHVLVNMDGRIVKVTNSVEEMEPFLKREAKKLH